MILARRGLLASLLGTSLGGCSAAAMLNATVPSEGFSLERHIPYGPLPRQKLDLYRPDRPRADGRSVIFFYGGAWDSGDKGDYLFVGQALAARGLTTIKLYPEIDHVDVVAALSDFLHRRAPTRDDVLAWIDRP